MFPKVAIIILNWNGWKDTIECLESVFRNTYPNYQVIVVDNGSTDGSIEKIKVWAEGKQKVLTSEPTHPLYHLSHPTVKKPIPYIYYTREEAEKGGNFIFEEKAKKEWQERRKVNSRELDPTSFYPLIFIQTGENLGFAGGNNIGIKYILKSNSYYILLLNNDLVVDKYFLKPLLEVAEKDELIPGIIGSKIYYYDRPNIIQSIGARMNIWTGRGLFIGNKEYDNGNKYSTISEVDWISGAIMFIKSSIFQKIDLLDIRYFLFYEETDLCFRAKRQNFKIYVVPSSKVWHKGGASTTSSIAEYFLTVNRMRFFKNNTRIFSWPVFILFYLAGSFKRFLIFSLRKNKDSANAVLKGVVDGFKIFFKQNKF